MTDLTKTDQINDALVAAGIPFDWVRNVDGTAAHFEIYFLPQATDQQKADAQAIVASILP